jgi:hypothetical protein
MRNSRDFTYDHDTLLKDAGLVAASAAATVSSVAKILDLGTARMDKRTIIDVSAIEVATGDEKYELEMQFSTSPTFASGNIVGSVLKLGDSTVNGGSADSVVGRYELPWTNEFNGTVYRYARLYTRVAGTIATGINFTAFVAAP